jgi:alpha-tubulin suppressor-like RCC1 family protein
MLFVVGGCADLLGADFDRAGAGVRGTDAGVQVDESAPAPNPTPDAGPLAPPACRPGRLDCNHESGDGCEVNPKTDPANCGACGVQCAASEVCGPTGCADSCTAPLTKCGQSCVDLSADELHCGGCTNACPTTANGSATCAAATCAIECDPGFAQCGIGCCSNAPQAPSRIAAGWWFTCALTSSNSAKCWGEIVEGQRWTAPTAIAGLPTDVIDLSAGLAHACARTSGGAVYCWGQSDQGQTGAPDGGTDAKANAIPGLGSGALAVAAGGDHACAIDQNHALRCWGKNDHGQLGDGTTTTRYAPVAVTNMGTNVTAVANGSFHTCAVQNGALYCWGNNEDAELGDGTRTLRTTPVAVVGMTSNVIAVAAGDAHTCALKAGGSVYCWGYNEHGEIGDGTFDDSAVPQPVSGLGSGVTALSAKAGHTCALVGATVRCWGDNEDAELGNQTTNDSSVPVNVASLASPIAVAAGAYQTCASTASNDLYCWGSNAHGEIGGGTASCGGGDAGPSPCAKTPRRITGL